METKTQHEILRVMLPQGAYRAGDVAEMIGAPAGGTGMALRALEKAGLVKSEWAYNSRGNRAHRVFRLTPEGVVKKRVLKNVRWRGW